jgi:osmotically inducible lipoprotein OsmB
MSGGMKMVRAVLKKSVLAIVIVLAVMFGSLVVTDEANAAHKTGRYHRHSKKKGAIVGGVVGAVGGALIGGKKGALIGAGAGAGTGYLVQRHRNKKHRRVRARVR